jgi:hypothetical protein
MAIVERLKNLTLASSPSLLDLFIIFYDNFTASNSYIESFFPDNDQFFVFGYQTRDKFVLKFILWDNAEMKYRELDMGSKDNNFLRTFMMQNGITNLNAYLSSSRTKYNYILIGSKINKDRILSSSELLN